MDAGLRLSPRPAGEDGKRSQNHAHDSIGCCCSDKVHREIVSRFELAEDMADNPVRFYMRKIVDNMPQSDADKLVMFNLMPGRVKR